MIIYHDYDDSYVDYNEDGMAWMMRTSPPLSSSFSFIMPVTMMVYDYDYYDEEEE